MKRMIKTALPALVIFAMAATAHAGEKQIGVKGGVAIEKVNSDDGDSDSRTGFVGGAFFQNDFSKSFGLRLEGLYFQKGAHEEEGGDELTIKLDYIEFPILAVAHVPLSETARLDFFGGPTLGFNVKSELEVEIGGVSASADLDGAESFEFGLTFGAGLNFDAGSVILGVDGRYGIGLTNIADDSGDDGAQNQGFAVMGSIGFPIGPK